MARFLAQMIVLGAQAVGRAFSQALRQEYQATAAARRAAEEAGRSGPNAAKASALTGMDIKEANQILNIEDMHNIEAVRKNYYHLFKVNDKKAGGSFYLQSKVVRAKERLELELDREIAATETGHGNQTDDKSDSDSSSNKS